MGIIHGNIFEHSLRVRHFVASYNLGTANVRFCGFGGSRLSDHVYFYGDLDSSLVSVAADVQLDCFKTGRGTGYGGHDKPKTDRTYFTRMKGVKGMCERIYKRTESFSNADKT